MVWIVRLGFPVLVICFFVLLYMLNDHTSKKAHHNSTKLDIDDKIPFVSSFAAIYFSAYIFGMMAYFFLYSHPILPKVILGYFLLVVLIVVIHYIYPTKVVRYEDIEPSSFSTQFITLFQTTSKPYNNFPSLHVSLCLYSSLAVWSYGSQGWGLVLLIWSLFIAASTLFLKQHYFLDIVGGAVVGVGIYGSLLII